MDESGSIRWIKAGAGQPRASVPTSPRLVDQRLSAHRACIVRAFRSRLCAPHLHAVGLSWLEQRRTPILVRRSSKTNPFVALFVDQQRMFDANCVVKPAGYMHWHARPRSRCPSARREIAYVSRARDRQQLRFRKSGALAIEQASRTHWGLPELSVTKQERLVKR